MKRWLGKFHFLVLDLLGTWKSSLIPSFVCKRLCAEVLWLHANKPDPGTKPMALLGLAFDIWPWEFSKKSECWLLCWMYLGLWDRDPEPNNSGCMVWSLIISPGISLLSLFSQHTLLSSSISLRLFHIVCYFLCLFLLLASPFAFPYLHISSHVLFSSKASAVFFSPHFAILSLPLAVSISLYFLFLLLFFVTGWMRSRKYT